MNARDDAPPQSSGALRFWLPLLALLLIVGGALLHTSGADAVWMAHVHAQAPSAFSVLAWSCLTILGLGSSALILVLAADRGDGDLAALLVPVFLLGALLTHVPKWIVAAPRPAATGVPLHVIGQTYVGAVSMPSGHAVTAGAATILLCLALARGRSLVIALLAIAGVAVAWSRVVVGAHWPSDVFVGLGLGLAAVVLVVFATNRPGVRRAHAALARGIRTKRGQFAVAAVEIAAAAALVSEARGYPAALPMVVLLITLAAGSALLRFRFALSIGGRRAPAGPT